MLKTKTAQQKQEEEISTCSQQPKSCSTAATSTFFSPLKHDEKLLQQNYSFTRRDTCLAVFLKINQKLLVATYLQAFPHCLKITQTVAFEFCHFPLIFVLLKLTCLVTLFDRKLQVFKNSPKWTIFFLFSQLWSTHNVNVARFACNVE